MNLLGSLGESKLPSVIKDPFSKTKITSINVFFEDYWGRGEWTATGIVKFKNGNTEGRQEFKGATFDDVVLQIKSMIENM